MIKPKVVLSRIKSAPPTSIGHRNAIFSLPINKLKRYKSCVIDENSFTLCGPHYTHDLQTKRSAVDFPHK